MRSKSNSTRRTVPKENKFNGFFTQTPRRTIRKMSRIVRVQLRTSTQYSKLNCISLYQQQLGHLILEMPIRIATKKYKVIRNKF